MAIVRILAAAAVTVVACSGAFAGPKQQGFSVTTVTTGGSSKGFAAGAGFGVETNSNQTVSSNAGGGAQGAGGGTTSSSYNSASAKFGVAASGGQAGAGVSVTSVQSK